MHAPVSVSQTACQYGISEASGDNFTELWSL